MYLLRWAENLRQGELRRFYRYFMSIKKVKYHCSVIIQFIWPNTFIKIQSMVTNTSFIEDM